jgi:hypothetical protein
MYTLLYVVVQCRRRQNLLPIIILYVNYYIRRTYDILLTTSYIISPNPVLPCSPMPLGGGDKKASAKLGLCELHASMHAAPVH